MEPRSRFATASASAGSRFATCVAGRVAATVSAFAGCVVFFGSITFR